MISDIITKADVSENIQVYVRVKPTLENERKELSNENDALITCPDERSIQIDHQSKLESFMYDKIFWSNSSQVLGKNLIYRRTFLRLLLVLLPRAVFKVTIALFSLTDKQVLEKLTPCKAL